MNQPAPQESRDDEVVAHLEATSALLDGHFRLSSGLHSARYMQCARVLMYPERAGRLCELLRQRYEGVAPDVVIGPAMGGVTFAYELARAFGTPGLFAERLDGVFTLRRGFAVKPGQKVVIAEDVVTTGGSVKELMAVLRQLGVEIVAVCCLVQRADENPFDVPLYALHRERIETWSESDCPMCRDGRPVVKPGSRPEGAA